MDWSAAGQALAAGLGAALPVAGAIVWVIRKVFSLGKWQETLATKEHMASIQKATKEDIDALRVATKEDLNALQQSTTKQFDETRTEVSELKASVAVLASSVEATRTDVGRILDHLLGSKDG